MTTLTLLLAAVAADPGAQTHSARSADSAPPGVLLNFTASWCGPCREMNPVVSRLQRQGHPVRKVDVDQKQELAKRFKVSGIPTFVLVVDGREVDRIVGPTSEDKLKGLLAQIPQTAAPAASRPGPPGEGSSRPQSALPATETAESQPARRRGIQLPFFNKGRQEEPTKEDPFAGEDEPTFRAKIDAREEAPSATAGDPFASSTRIRVKNQGGINFGSGTIIESKPGRTIILTCGHLFRDLSREARIEVDVFEGQGVEKYLGEVIRYDLKADIGLISIPTDARLSVAKVGTAETAVSEGDGVVSIGCGGGEPPSKQQLRVTGLNRYLGPDNIECSGVPVPGRSGGGLFNSSGELVGVCFAADQRDQRGLYAGLGPIHQLLDRANLSHVYRRTEEPAPHEQKFDLAALGRQEQQADGEAEPAGERQFVSLETPFDSGDAQAAEEALDPDQLAAVSETMDGAGEAEVICIIRPLDDPQASSRVVVINRASSKFVSYLDGEIQQQPQPTMQSVRFDAKPLEGMESSGTGTAERWPSSSPEAGAVEPQRYRRSAASRGW